MNFFKDKYLICWNKSINIFDISDPECIKLLSSHPQNDFINQAELIKENYLLVTYYTAWSVVFEINWNAKMKNMEVNLRGSDYQWEGPGVFIGLKYDNLHCPKAPKNIDRNYGCFSKLPENLTVEIRSKHLNYLVWDSNGFLRINEINESPVNDEEKYRIRYLGKINAQMNILKKGFLIKNQDIVGEKENGFHLTHIQKNTYIFGTNSGKIGMLQVIPKEIFDQMSSLERSMDTYL